MLATVAVANSSGTPAAQTQAAATPEAARASSVAMAAAAATASATTPAPLMMAALLQALQVPGNEAILAEVVEGLAPPAGTLPAMTPQALPAPTARPPSVLRNARTGTVATLAPPAAGRAVGFLDATAANALYATGAMPRVLDSALAAAANGTAGTPKPAEDPEEEGFEPTLVEALKWTAGVGGEDDDIAADLAF